MRALFFIAYFSFLLSWASSQQYQDFNDSDEPSSEDSKDFFRMLLLSRYGPGAPEYIEPEEDSASDQFFYNSDPETLDVPFRQLVQNYVDWKKQEDERNQEEQTTDEPAEGSQHTKRSKQTDKLTPKMVPTVKVAEETTTKMPSTTTSSGSDLLASIPPVTPNKGQKEFVMLRPPVDNHRKIENYLKSLSKGIFGADRHYIKKRDLVLPIQKSN